jgi:hypothetical protein
MSAELVNQLMKNQREFIDSHREAITAQMYYGIKSFYSPYVPLTGSAEKVESRGYTSLKPLTEPCRGCGASETVVHAGQRSCSYCRRTR